LEEDLDLQVLSQEVEVLVQEVHLLVDGIQAGDLQCHLQA